MFEMSPFNFSAGKQTFSKEIPPDSHGGSRKTKTEPGLGSEAIFVTVAQLLEQQQAEIS